MDKKARSDPGPWVIKGRHAPVIDLTLMPRRGAVHCLHALRWPRLETGLSMRDVIMQPGSKTMVPPMENAMVCHIAEGELQVEQDGRTFTAKKNFVWTCNRPAEAAALAGANQGDPIPWKNSSSHSSAAMCAIAGRISEWAFISPRRSPRRTVAKLQ
jgi:hypothetical protein